MSIAEKDIATYLDAQGVGTLGTDLFYGMLPVNKPSTASIAAILNSGGAGNKPTKEDFERQPTIEVFISGKPDDPGDAYTFMRAIQLGLQGAYFTSTDSIKYVMTAQSGGINNLGRDAERRPQYSMNFQFTATEDR